MAENKVLLVNLLDTESDQFIASLITAKFRQATFGRRNIHDSERTPYYLYVDECHTVLKFAENDFNALLTRSRQFQLCLILANQFPSDLPESIHSKLRVLQASILFRNIPDYLTPFRSAFPRPVPPPQYPQRRRDTLKKQKEIADEVTQLWMDFDRTDETYGEFFKPNQLPRLNQKSLAIQREIKELDEEYQDALVASVPDYMQTITKLGVGEAICIPVVGQPFEIKTPDPLQKHSQDGCAEYLMMRTKEHYPCAIPEKLHTETIVPSDDDFRESPQTVLTKRDA